MRTLDSHTDGPAHQKELKEQSLILDHQQPMLQIRIQIPPTMEMIMILEIIGIDLLNTMVVEADFQIEVM